MTDELQEDLQEEGGWHHTHVFPEGWEIAEEESPDSGDSGETKLVEPESTEE